MRSLIYGTLAILLLVTTSGLSAPEPAVVQGPGEWTVEATYEHPQRVLVRLKPGTEPVGFWYMILTVTNNTGKEVGFYHRCDLVTDTFQVVAADKDVPAGVCNAIKARHAKKYPFLEPLAGTAGNLLEGEDNAKDILIVWRDFDPKAKGVKVYITGLSNETAVVEHPIAKDDSGNPTKIYLRKTLVLEYGLKGGSSLRSGADLVFKGRSWVMR